MKKIIKKLTVTIGIPTYEAGENLIPALASIYKQSSISKIKEIILVVDGNKISTNIYKQISHPKLRVVNFKKREGQSSRVNDLFRLSDSQLFILTNDDVILEKDAAEKIINAYKKDESDLISGSVIPLQISNLLQKVLKMGPRITTDISKQWNNNDNFLSCNGRLIALSRKNYKGFDIPEKLWNNDAYIFISTKLRGLKYLHVEDAIGRYQIPESWKEHLRQSWKFQRSFIENNTYFNKDLSSYYKIPTLSIISALTSNLFQRPFLLISYMMIMIFTRLTFIFSKNSTPRSGYWNTDKSTKKLSNNL